MTTTLVHPRDELVVHISENGDFLVDGEIVESLRIATEAPPVRLEVVDRSGTWTVRPGGAWRAEPAVSGVYALLDYTDGEEFVSLDIELERSDDRQQTLTRSLAIKVKPAVAAFDADGGVLASGTSSTVPAGLLATVEVTADYGSLSDFAELIAAIDELNLAALASVGCGDRRTVRLVGARMNSPLLISFGIFVTVVSLAPPLLIAIWRTIDALVQRAEARTALEQAFARGMEVLVRTCGEFGREPDEKSAVAIELLAGRMLEFASLARRQKVELRVGPVELRNEK